MGVDPQCIPRIMAAIHSLTHPEVVGCPRAEEMATGEGREREESGDEVLLAYEEEEEEEGLPAYEEVANVQEEGHLIMYEENVSAQEDGLPMYGQVASVQEEGLLAFEENASAQEEGLPMYGQVASVQGEGLLANEGNVCAQEEGLPAYEQVAGTHLVHTAGNVVSAGIGDAGGGVGEVFSPLLAGETSSEGQCQSVDGVAAGSQENILGEEELEEENEEALGEEQLLIQAELVREFQQQRQQQQQVDTLQSPLATTCDMGWLRFVGSLKL